MKNKVAKKAIALYFLLSFFLMAPLLIMFWFIKSSLVKICYFIFFIICLRIATNFAARATIMSSLSKELDAEKYAAIINAWGNKLHYSYKLVLYLAVGDYQAAYNLISSVLLNNKSVHLRIYGRLVLCRVCFERGDYEGIKDNLAEIDGYCKYNPKLKLKKQDKLAYERYNTFANADYVSVCNVLEKSIEKYSKKKNDAYLILINQYQLAVAKRMNGDIDEATVLFESIKEKAPKLAVSTLAQKQLEYISGFSNEETPERLEVTEKYTVKSNSTLKVIFIVAFCICYAFLIISEISIEPDDPKQENKNLEYIAEISSSIEDDYEEYQILGYFNIYTDYADETYTMIVDSLFLVEANGKLDLHTPYQLNGECQNHLNVSDVQVDKLYEYEIYFVPQKVEFVLTEKKRDIPKNTLYYYEIDGYYFCVISISDN